MTSGTKSITWVALIILCIALGLSFSRHAPPVNEGPTLNTLQDVKQTKIIHAAYVVYPPTVEVDKDPSHPTGFLIDIMNEIAVRAGWTIEYTPTTFDDINAAISSPKNDIIVGGIFVNIPRAKEMSLTVPIMYWNGVSAISAFDKVSQYTTLESVDEPGIKIAVTAGTAEYDFVKQHITKATIDAIPNSDISLTLSEVTSGHADIAFGDAVTIGKFVQAHPNVGVLFNRKPFNTYAASFVVKENDHAWLDFINAALLSLQVDGTIDQFSQKWGGNNIWFLPKRPWE